MMIIIINQSLKKNYKYYESREDKGQKKLSVKEYLYMIMPHLADLINEQKNKREESKIQLNMGMNFISSKDRGETRTFLCGVIMKKLDRPTKQLILLISFLNLF